MADVTTPFRIRIPKGTSTFVVQVPRDHFREDRKFFFNHLQLTPDFFSLDAETQRLDADPDLDQVKSVEVQVILTYPDAKVYGVYQNAPKTKFSVVAVQKVNAAFEQVKPSYTYTSPFFFDWVDANMDSDHIPNEYVPELATLYYNEDYNERAHFNWLPSSVRRLPGVNNFLPPILYNKFESTLTDRIRLRMWMGPFTKVSFSSLEPFVTHFGFDESVFGPLGQHRQYHLVNDSSFYRPVAVATSAPLLELFSKVDWRIVVSVSEKKLVTEPHQIELTKREWKKDRAVFEALWSYFDKVSQLTNTKFSLAYDKETRIFSFYMPSADTVHVSVHSSPDFAARLGFGETEIITKNMKAQPSVDPNMFSQAMRNARSVVYDTGPIVCTLEDSASNRTSGTVDQFMAALYPDVSGTLNMPQSICSCAANAVHIKPIVQSWQGHVPIAFRLLRIYEDQKMADFRWNSDAYIIGTLQGTCLPQNGIKTGQL